MTDTTGRVAGDGPASDPDEDLVFEDGASTLAPPARAPWTLLVVDDDEDVHSATTFALAGLEVLGRPLRLLHARSAAEARAVLEVERDIAAILLDVVMETQDAGLRLVSQIREDLGRLDTRIILRTGQPGYAPEIEAIRNYDINDYKTKSELTQARLFATLTTAIRSYEQIRQIDAGRRGLERVVGAAATILGSRGVRELAHEVAIQLDQLLGSSGDALVCAHPAPGCAHVLAARGRFARLEGLDLSAADAPLLELVAQAAAGGRPLSRGGYLVVPLTRGEEERILAVLVHEPALDELSGPLVDVFVSNVALGLKNAVLLTQLQAAAYVDPLCDIPNRARLVLELDARIDGARGGTLALVDLDAFADVNDALGHRFGDRLLRAVRDRLVAFAGDAALVARVAGDVFAVLGASSLVEPAQIQALFAEPFRLEDADTPLTVTVGMVRLDDGDGDGAAALKEATIALRRAKADSGGGHAYFTRDMAARAAERVQMLHALRRALEARRLHLAYQPQLELRTGRVIGLEALVRWRGDDGKLIPPDRFIPVAERSGLILPLGAFVLEEALLAHGRLAKAGLAGLRMSVNVSMYQVRLAGFVDDVLATLAKTGAPPSEIELEITESVAMEDPALVGSKLGALKKVGLTFAIDDFGTGFSSLSQLQRLDVDRLKVDRAFVNALDDIRGGGDATRGVRIADTIIQLARTLELSTIAEGVETEAQREKLVELGCREAQGYLFARPLPEAELLAWLAARAEGARAEP